MKHSSYPGGKGGAGVYQQLINLIPPHTTYIALFAGRDAILRKKRPALANIAIDIDPAALDAIANSGEAPDKTLFLQSCALLWLQGNNEHIHSETFIYVDPPYLMETRSSRRNYYPSEFATIEEHTDLLQYLQACPCKVLVSHYYHPLYAQMLSNWHWNAFRTKDRANNPKVEWCWHNYATPETLHDYSFLGSNYRERERIKRKTNRWTAQLLSMPPLERNAIISAIRNTFTEN